MMPTLAKWSVEDYHRMAAGILRISYWVYKGAWQTMGMPCEINTILKLTPAQGYPTELTLGDRHQAQKGGYRIFAVDVPVALVDENWIAHADVVIETLTWHQQTTCVEYRISRLYDAPMALK